MVNINRKRHKTRNHSSFFGNLDQKIHKIQVSQFQIQINQIIAKILHIWFFGFLIWNICRWEKVIELNESETNSHYHSNHRIPVKSIFFLCFGLVVNLTILYGISIQLIHFNKNWMVHYSNYIRAFLPLGLSGLAYGILPPYISIYIQIYSLKDSYSRMIYWKIICGASIAFSLLLTCLVLPLTRNHFPTKEYFSVIDRKGEIGILIPCYLLMILNKVILPQGGVFSNIWVIMELSILAILFLYLHLPNSRVFWQDTAELHFVAGIGVTLVVKGLTELELLTGTRMIIGILMTSSFMIKYCSIMITNRKFKDPFNHRTSLKNTIFSLVIFWELRNANYENLNQKEVQLLVYFQGMLRKHSENGKYFDSKCEKAPSEEKALLKLICLYLNKQLERNKEFAIYILWFQLFDVSTFFFKLNNVLEALEIQKANNKISCIKISQIKSLLKNSINSFSHSIKSKLQNTEFKSFKQIYGEFTKKYNLENKNLEINKILEQKKNYEKVVENILKLNLLHLDIYQYLIGEKILRTSKIFKMNKRIFINREMIEKEIKLLQREEMSSYFLILFSCYYSMLTYQPTKADHNLQKYKRKLKEIRYHLNIPDEYIKTNNTELSSAVLEIGLDKKNLGVIMRSSPGAEHYLGKPHSGSIKENYIDSLIPKIIRQEHREMLNSREAGLQQMNQIINTAVLGYDGYIKRCKIFLMYSPSLKNGASILVYLKFPIKDKKPLIHVNAKGKIEHWNKEFEIAIGGNFKGSKNISELNPMLARDSSDIIQNSLLIRRQNGLFSFEELKAFKKTEAQLKTLGKRYRIPENSKNYKKLTETNFVARIEHKTSFSKIDFLLIEISFESKFALADTTLQHSVDNESSFIYEGCSYYDYDMKLHQNNDLINDDGLVLKNFETFVSKDLSENKSLIAELRTPVFKGNRFQNSQNITEEKEKISGIELQAIPEEIELVRKLNEEKKMVEKKIYLLKNDKHENKKKVDFCESIKNRSNDESHKTNDKLIKKEFEGNLKKKNTSMIFKSKNLKKNQT